MGPPALGGLADTIGQAKSDKVVEDDVKRLDVRRGLEGDDDADIGELLHRATVEAAETDGVAAAFAGELHGAEEVLRPLAGLVAPAAAVYADGEQDIAGPEERFELFEINLVPAVV